MLKRFIVLALLLGAGLVGSGLLVGCGQKGPLYLPAHADEQRTDENEKRTDEKVEEKAEPVGSPSDNPVKNTHEEKTSTN